MFPVPNTIQDFVEGAAPYVKLFDAFAAKHGLEEKVSADHICFKCATKSTFEMMRRMFESESEYVYQSIISNRRIAIVKLKKPILTALGPIFFVELSDQKPDGSQRNAYDHIEAYPTSAFLLYADMINRFQKTEQVIEVKRPHHSTHDVDIGRGFLFRSCREPLIQKIKREEL